MMRRIATTIAVATVVVATGAMAGGVPALAASHGPTATTASSFYLSLGDSLAQGVQPNAQGVSVETNQGYPDQLFTALRLGNPTLNLVKLGCPGETTLTMINGGICSYPTGSQLNQAAAFLASHKGHVQLVTIDIGANDLNPCLPPNKTTITAIAKCLNKVFPKLAANLTAIMNVLTSANGSSGPPPIIGMTYYDPELANWLVGTPAAKTLAKDSVALAQLFGNLLSGVYTQFGAKVADVFKTFHTTIPFSTKVTLPAFGKVPKAVGYICSYTWMCAAPPVGPNIHANQLGYGVIANTFLDVIFS
jgi:lysophospholipase L1-like esterase